MMQLTRPGGVWTRSESGRTIYRGGGLRAVSFCCGHLAGLREWAELLHNVPHPVFFTARACQRFVFYQSSYQAYLNTGKYVNLSSERGRKNRMKLPRVVFFASSVIAVVLSHNNMLR